MIEVEGVRVGGGGREAGSNNVSWADQFQNKRRAREFNYLTSKLCHNLYIFKYS